MVARGYISFSALLICSLGSVAADAPSDKPVQFLVDSANALLAKGNTQEALEYFDKAIQKDPTNYLTIFKRGATYLSLGKVTLAATDFDEVLNLKPDFDSALIQRSKIKTRIGDWKLARRDLTAAGRRKEDILAIDEAEEAEEKAAAAEKNGDFDGCIQSATKTLSVAPALLSMRERRARCRLAIGDVEEAIADLSYVSQMVPSAIEIHVKLAKLLFYSLNDSERAITQLRKCLHSDPDCKTCKSLRRRIKNLGKSVETSKSLKNRRQLISAGKILTGTTQDPGVIPDIKADIQELVADGLMNSRSPRALLAELLGMACSTYWEAKQTKKSAVYCDEVLKLDENSIPGLISKGSRLITEDKFEEAMSLLNKAKELDPQNGSINEQLKKAQVLLKRSKQKDYYKVLDVSRDASDRDIKTAYRRLTKKFHPDKARTNGLTAEEAEKKMASINEAYEVLSNQELRARFDSGDDPNSQEAPPFQHGRGFPFGQGFPGGGQQFFFKQGGGGGGGGGHPFGGGFQGGEFKFNF